MSSNFEEQIIYETARQLEAKTGSKVVSVATGLMRELTPEKLINKISIARADGKSSLEINYITYELPDALNPEALGLDDYLRKILPSNYRAYTKCELFEELVPIDLAITNAQQGVIGALTKNRCVFVVRIYWGNFSYRERYFPHY
jgi:hypothetical protein